MTARMKALERYNVAADNPYGGSLQALVFLHCNAEGPW